LSNGTFKDETRMHLSARKVQQNGHKSMPPLQYSKNKDSKILINFISHWQLQYKLCGLISDKHWLLLPHTAYSLTRRSHNRHPILVTVIQLWCLRAEVMVAMLALLGPNFRDLVPNSTCWPQNCHLALWLFFGTFPG